MPKYDEMNITIDTKGKVKIDVIDANGVECNQIIDFLIKSLGEVETKKMKQEYYNVKIKTHIKNKR